MVPETVRRRLHVSGLTPQITAAHLKDRFSSFGQVSEVEDLGLNAVGQHRPFTFLTIDTTPAQLQKCLNIMSGSTWRGARLLIAPAKPSYGSRLDKERNPPMEEVRKKAEKQRKRKRLEMGDDVGREAQDMRLVTFRNYTSRKHWIMTEDGRLVRPLAMRPSHPLPLPSSAAVGAKEKRRMLLKRARRRVINPVTWEPTHLVDGDFPVLTKGREEEGWIYEDLQDQEAEEADEDGRRTIGVWRKGDQEQIVRVHVPQSGTAEREEGVDQVEEEGEGEWEGASQASTSSALFGHRPAKSRSASPLFPPSHDQPNGALDLEDGEDEMDDIPSQSEVAESSGRSASPLFASRPAPAEQSEVEEEGEKRSASAPPSRSSSPLFASHHTAIASASRSPPSPPPPRPQLSEEIRNLAKAERAQNVSLLSSFLADLDSGPSTPAASTSRKNEWAGFSESDSEDDAPAVEGIPLRLRGGADPDASGSETEESEDDSDDSESSEDPSDSSDSHEGSEESNEGDEEAHKASQPAPAPPKPKGGLKDMFAPTPSTSAPTGFSLADLGAEMDIDETMSLPLPSLSTGATEPALEPLAQTMSKKALFEVDQGMPLFFPTSLIAPTSGGLGGGGGRTNDPAATYALLSNGAVPPLANGGADAEGQEGEVKEEGFWAQETDAQMREIWAADKYGLTKGWKRRAREGRKQKRRRGGAEDDD